MTNEDGSRPRLTGKEIRALALPKRFYETVTVAPHAEGASPVGREEGIEVGGATTAEAVESRPAYLSHVRGEGSLQTLGKTGYRIVLDGKAVRTPAKAMLAVPTRALAEAIAAEWQAQREHIDAATMPLTRLVNSALDGVRGREAEVRADIVKYAASDLLCYRASEPVHLAQRQAELWDPVLAWGRDVLGANYEVAEGLMPVAQPEAATSAIAEAMADCDAFTLAALHVMTTLMGSALLAVAHARGHLTAEAAWAAAHVDEDWQIARWGEDAEAAARRRQRWSEMQAASRMLALRLEP